MESRATLKSARISARKVKIVIDLIRGKDVAEAIAILKYTPKAASPLVEKLLKSAIANAENNHNMKVDKLYVAEGAQPIITKTLDRGNKNPAKNPLLTTWQDLNDQALTYMNSLGLTAKGLKQIKDSQGIERQTSFEDFVNMIERETAEAESKGNNKNDN